MARARYVTAAAIVVWSACATQPVPAPPAAAVTTGAEQPAASALPADAAIDPEATNYPYPYPVAFYDFDSQLQPLRMAYLDVHPAPDKANGKTALLLHGKNFGSYAWATTIAALTAEGYRVVAPDQLGFGKSS